MCDRTILRLCTRFHLPLRLRTAPAPRPLPFQVVEICTHFLELTDARSDCMGIFVYDVAPDGSVPDPDADKP